MLRHLPNGLTVLRILLVAPLCVLVLSDRPLAALGVAALAGATDALDGFLARRFGWQSRLGGVLDPLADKLLLDSGFVTLAIIGAVPVWLAALVVGRDLVILAGALAWHLLIGAFDAVPSLLSKLTTAAQLTLVLAVLVAAAGLLSMPATGIQGLVVVVALLTLASGLHYVITWSRRAWLARGAS